MQTETEGIGCGTRVRLPLRVLIIEDSQEDALLLVRELQRGGYDLLFQRIDQNENLRKNLDQEWDLIIADYASESLHSQKALDAIRESDLDVPVIVVSDGMEDQVVVDAMKAGAHDCIRKGDWARLIPAIKRELRETEVRQKRRQAETALREVEGRMVDLTASRAAEEKFKEKELWFQRIFDHALDPMMLVADSGRHVDVNPAAERLTGYSREQLLEMHIWDLAAAGDAESIRTLWGRFITDGRQTGEYRLRCREGKIVETEYCAVANIVPGVHFFALRDITERNRSRQELGRYNERLRVFSRQLLEAQETERRRIARELHNQIGQALTMTKINLRMLEEVSPAELPNRLREAAGDIDRLLNQVRNLSLALRPPMLDDLGLKSALRWYVDQQAKLSGVQVRFELDGGERRLDPGIETACFRVAQEAITNAIRHSRATEVSLRLSFSPDAVRLAINDNGTGFDRDAVPRESLGLISMEERTALAGGEFSCRSAPGHGTEIQASFPHEQKLSAAISKGDYDKNPRSVG